MKKIRVLCLLLILSTLLSLLAACSFGDTVVNDGGNRGENGSWDGVDFGGQKVRLCLSSNKYDECNFPAAVIYTKGPDTAGSNEVAKEVLARNKRAGEELSIEVEYSLRDLTYDKVLEDMRGIVQTSSKSSPDIYSNDMYGLTRAMIDGLLWNVKSPGDDVKNYFDFSAKGFYTEFMKGCTFDQSKYYIFAGDYFIDMIRMAWVIYVNNDLFSAQIKKMPTWCDSLATFYEYVEEGFWDVDTLTAISSRVFTDGGSAGETEYTDPLVGLAINHVSDWVLQASSQVTLYYQDEEDAYIPKMISSIDEFQRLSNKYVELATAPGVYYDPLVQDSTARFLGGNFLFAFSRLGEMESAGLRDFSAAKGLVPIPKWNQNEQDEYHTMVHDQAELGCILNTAQAYSAASALMQFLNEESGDVVHAYYEKGLKYKYNDDKNARTMMDIVRATTDTPFGAQVGGLCTTLYTGTTPLEGLGIDELKNPVIASTFASERDAYSDCLQQMLAKFKTLK